MKKNLLDILTGHSVSSWSSLPRLATTLLVLPLAVACESAPEVFVPDDDDNPRVGDGDGDGDGGDGDLNVGDGDGDDGGDGDGDNAADPVCGNGLLEVGELCDDDNKRDGDGCSGDCSEVDPDFLCSEGEDCVRVVTCGNGVIEGSEVCDDGDEESGDGCSEACDEIEEGFACPKPGVECIVLPVCGNGVRERGEQCDDNDDEADDGCDDACQLEEGYFCPPGEECILIECGDGFRTPNEACDDNDTDDGDGCSSLCQVEEGWICSQSGCKGICGDGIVVESEACDDNNLTTGDGCSAACRVEPFYTCDDSEPSVCASDIVCGNGVLNPTEVCDPGDPDAVPPVPGLPGHEACYGPDADPDLACKAFDSGLVDPPVCGNGVVEYQEDCDSLPVDGGGTFEGCTACDTDLGYVCPAPGVCFLIPECGDGILQAGEECDTGLLMSDPGSAGCDNNCELETGYFCSGEPSICVVSECGDGELAPDEACDDGGTGNDDGCDENCFVEDGWVCPPGIDCQAVCGNYTLETNEECDTEPCDPMDSACVDDEACINCRVQPGYQCVDPLGGCEQTECGNGEPADGTLAAAIAEAEPGEGCDDGNEVAGDGCGPTCQLEPTFTRDDDEDYPTPVANVFCGDGLITGTEECDDGNDLDDDGCTDCVVDDGYVCQALLDYPDQVEMQVTYRDWMSDEVNYGHPDFEDGSGVADGVPGPVCTATANAKCTTDAGVACPASTCGHLDVDGKPVWHGTTGGKITSADSFATWYRNGTLVSGNTYENDYGVEDVSSGNNYDSRTAVFTESIVLESVSGSPGTYHFDNNGAQLFPLDGRGLGNEGRSHNYHFTTELRYFFQYQGGETLTFSGDDDVWVFVNGRHAVDIGGVHCALAGRVVLGDVDSDCSIHGEDYDGDCALTGDLPACGVTTYADTDTRFGLEKGEIYEIVLFHAERQTSQSNFNLTLAGFLAPRSFCETDCGDNIRAGNELCDGTDTPASAHNGYCVPEGQPGECTFEFCGDGTPNGNEECDNGSNSDLYGSGCAPGCVLPPTCGDGELQVNFDEECDFGEDDNEGGYGGCTDTCELGPYCGDGFATDGEFCDCGGDAPCEFTTYGDGEGECNFNCTEAPYCGDDARNGTEVCDGPEPCNDLCQFDPFCGDGLPTDDEECDYGSFAYTGDPADAPYGSCSGECELGPYCGDSETQDLFGEECDLGGDNANNVYNGCTDACLWGPHCGDGIHQPEAMESCDNGFNEDVYAYSDSACGQNCTPVPYCGDAVVQSAFEICDNGTENDDEAYNGCTESCDWGPYCGDGEQNGTELCDDGPLNTAYSADGEGCSYDCDNDVPYCGDGIRNGPEQCDDGTDDNDGDYGGCEADCTRAPYCGDNIVQKGQGETCDDGLTGSAVCSPGCRKRSVVR